MKKIFIYFAILTLTFTSCDITREPFGSISTEKIKSDPEASLESLLNGCYSQVRGWTDVMHRCGEYAGDNIMIRGYSTDAFFEFISYQRTPGNYRLQSFWDGSYKAIAQASNIINMVDEGQSKEIDNKLGECYFMRGFIYFYLCRAYGRPYYQSPESNLGVPILNGTPEDLTNYSLPDRSTVKDTYDRAIEDLKKSIELMTLEGSAISGSANAAKALLSRIYLYMSGTFDSPNNEYANLSIKYADEVINSGKYSLLDRNSFMKYNTLKPENNKETIFAIKKTASEFSGYDHFYGVGGMYAKIGGMGWGEMYASSKYIDLLDETGRNDWGKGKIVDARAAFIEPQYEKSDDKVFRYAHNLYNDKNAHISYTYSQDSIALRDGGKYVTINNIKRDKAGTVIDFTESPMTLVNEGDRIYSVKLKDGKTYNGVIDKKMLTNRGYPMFYIVKCSREGEESHLHSPVISRLAEVYLNKAEAAAKTGDYATALTALNIVRERSLPGKGYIAIDATNAEELITKERQLELAFQAERSYDVFRNGRKLTRHYPGPHKALEEVDATDYRVTYYIPQRAIDAYPPGSTLTQNPTQ